MRFRFLNRVTSVFFFSSKTSHYTLLQSTQLAKMSNPATDQPPVQVGGIIRHGNQKIGPYQSA